MGSGILTAALAVAAGVVERWVIGFSTNVDASGKVVLPPSAAADALVGVVIGRLLCGSSAKGRALSG